MELPISILPCVIFGTIVFHVVGFQDGTYATFIATLMLEAIAAIALGLCVSALAPTTEAAITFGPLAVIVALLFGGLFINLGSLPVVADWIPLFSFLRWTFQALVINEFKGQSFTCEYPVSPPPPPPPLSLLRIR